MLKYLGLLGGILYVIYAYTKGKVPPEGSLAFYVLAVASLTLTLYCAWNIRYTIEKKRFDKEVKNYKSSLKLSNNFVNELYKSYNKNSKENTNDFIKDVKIVLKQLEYGKKEIESMISDALSKKQFDNAEDMLKYILGNKNE